LYTIFIWLRYWLTKVIEFLKKQGESHKKWRFGWKLSVIWSI